MCVPTAVSAGKIFADVVSQVVPDVINYSNTRDNYKYRTQIALNNANSAKDEALRQKQLGINQARLEKISGLKELNKQRAISSASGFDLNSQTNQYSYEDAINAANSNAVNVQSKYDLQADSYFNQANSYLSQAKEQQKAYNSSLFNSTINSLGGFGKVAKEWYKEDSNDGGLTNVFI